jgi:hypothetical protein
VIAYTLRCLYRMLLRDRLTWPVAVFWTSQAAMGVSLSSGSPRVPCGANATATVGRSSSSGDLPRHLNLEQSITWRNVDVVSLRPLVSLLSSGLPENPEHQKAVGFSFT